MSSDLQTILPSNLVMPDEVQGRFQRYLPAAFEKLRARVPLDEALNDASRDILSAFNAERLTIYEVAEDKLNIISRLKTGLRSFKDLKLPIGEHSIAGFVALSARPVNLTDAYDSTELSRYATRLRFLAEVDKRTGFHTREMLAVPVVGEDRDVLGVIQIMNNRALGRFSAEAEHAAVELAKVVAVAFRTGADIVRPARSRYDGLIAQRIISAGNFALAERAARKRSTDVEQVLVEEFGISRVQIGQALAEFFHVPYEPFDPQREKPTDLLRNIRREYAEANLWLPIEDGAEGAVVLALDPERARAANVVRNVLGRSRGRYVVTTLAEFRSTIDLFFGSRGGGGNLGDLLIELEAESAERLPEDDVDARDEDVDAIADNEVVKLVNKIIIDAHQRGASDIHVESYPGRSRTEIRFRIDGSLVPYIEIPATFRNALVARIKVMCDLDIAERRRPQDGKINFRRFGPLAIELRVATVPVAGGVEDVVLRLLQQGDPIPIDKLGLLPHDLSALKEVIAKPYGIFFVCGPTGSGKTTTLHSVLSALNTPDTKIWTAEDPVEITQKGLRQVQVNRRAGMDFATVMRAFLRADPDIIMVGEMRDAETTAIGLEASLTGHRVFATLHTNSAPESIIRLLDMGMDPFNFADALLGVLAQRLAKRLCEQCRQPYTPDEDEVQMLLAEYCSELQSTLLFQADRAAAEAGVRAEWVRTYGDRNGQFRLYRRVGCPRCNQTGYKGRIGLHELLVATDPVKKMIQERARVAQVLTLALTEGMHTLKMNGVEKVLAGITDIAQVRAVCIK